MALQLVRTTLFSLVFVSIIDSSLSVSKLDLFPYGYAVDQKLVEENEDFNSAELTLTTPIVFYQQTYNTIHINENGLVSFLTEIASYFSIPFPLDYPVIAPFYSDVDIRSRGSVWYRESRITADIRRMSKLIKKHFSSAKNFEANKVVIVTWDDVGYYDSGNDRANTFQLVIATSDTDTFSLFIYPEKGIQWIQGTGKNPNLPDARAQSGFVAGDGRFFQLPMSGSDQVSSINRLSNIGVPGMWLFDIGRLGSGNVQSPNLETGNMELQQPQGAKSCKVGQAICHSKGTCVDYNAGFCCQCSPGYFGNGEHCLAEGVAQRINGKVSGYLNAIEFVDEDLHSYVVTNDGRAYTAVSKLDESIGYDLQTLSVIGGVIGWMFAKTSQNARNGYEMTGGKFNFSTEIEFPQSGHHCIIEQRFLGVDVFDYLKMNIVIQGTVPSVPHGSKIEIPDYEEQFVQTQHGRLQSSSRRVFRIEGSNLDIPFIIHHTVQFDECPFSSQKETFKTLALSVARNFVTYDPREKIVRYAMTNKISPSTEIVDPCIVGQHTCTEHSSCVVEGDSFLCVCNQGYEYHNDGIDSAVCYDIDECATETHRCDENALCINEEGGYKCQCNAGYLGDGFNCQKQDLCRRIKCPKYSQCITDERGQPDCHCLPGYEQVKDSDEFQCSLKEDPCTTCPENTQCIIDYFGQADCPCLPGFKRDAKDTLESGCTAIVAEPIQIISEDDCRRNFTCHQNAECVYDLKQDAYRCQCHKGFSGDGFDCSQQIGSCLVSNNCSQFATCEYNQRTESYACECLPGFQGDGYVCAKPTCVWGFCWCLEGFTYRDGQCHQIKQIPKQLDTKEKPSCDKVNVCHPHAQCVKASQSTNEYICECNAGYTGDGFQCVESKYDPVAPSVAIYNHLDQDSCDHNPEICSSNATCIYDDDTLQSICMCNQGFYGDGIRCTPHDGCNSPADCDANAQCLFNNFDQRFQCQCIEGYSGDGQTCIQIEIGESKESDCHANAVYALDDSNSRYTCQCIAGYIGNGTDCIEENEKENQFDTCHPNAVFVLGETSGQYTCQCSDGYVGNGTDCSPAAACNVDNNCHGNANCIFDQVEDRYKCVCVEGFTGDGLSCRPTSSCYNNQTICDDNASCILNSEGYYSCQCNEGYRGNGSMCKAVAKYDGNFLLISHGMSILRVPINPSEKTHGRPIYIQIFQAAVGIDIDCHEGRVYWGDVNGQSIRSVAYDGSNSQTFLDSDIGSPEGIAIDWSSRNMYWTDSSRDTIEVANLDSKIRRELFNTSLVNPRGIAVHPSRGLLFWTDWNREDPKIERSNTDGSNRQDFIKTDISLPNSLTIDTEKDEICWADAGLLKIECADIDGGNRRVIRSDVKYPFGLTHYGDRIFWTDWEEKSIRSASKDSDSASISLPVPLGGQGKLYGIVAVPESCPKVNSPCQPGAGGCYSGQLCLPSGANSRRCI